MSMVEEGKVLLVGITQELSEDMSLDLEWQSGKAGVVEIVLQYTDGGKRKVIKSTFDCSKLQTARAAVTADATLSARIEKMATRAREASSAA